MALEISSTDSFETVKNLNKMLRERSDRKDKKDPKEEKKPFNQDDEVDL